MDKYKVHALVVEQILEIRKLNKENEDYERRIKKAVQRLYSCGGPLNDNYHKYSKEQLKIFFDIEDLISGMGEPKDEEG